jgi:hypothetical protein
VGRRHISGTSLRRSLLCLAIAISLGGCASKPPAPPPHRWGVVSNVDDVPMQGLATVPRVVAVDRSLALANLENDRERDEQRRADMAAGAAAGAAQGAMLSLVALGPLCLFLPPLCLGVAAAGGASGASQMEAAAVSAEQASRLSAVFRAHATSAALRDVTAKRMPAADPQADELRVHVLGAVMIPQKSGVTFRLVAQAQAFPHGKPPWRPSVHFVPFPTRPVEEWLAADSQHLKTDLDAALSVLGAHIAPAYLPYRRR